MRFVHLSLRQFRNFSRLDLELGPGINVFVGPNGSGKSNILEAAAVLAQGQSHRGAEVRHWLQDGRDEAALVGRLEGEEEWDVDFRQKRGRPRQLRVNHRPISRQRDWAGKAPLVAFSPEELDLVRGEPAVRRRALNAILCQIDAEYADVWARYARTVEERNAALRRIREGAARAGSLEPWDLGLLRDGAWLTLSRRRFLLPFGPRVQTRVGELSRTRDRAAVLYRPSFHVPADDADTVRDANRTRLADVREGEIALGASLIGPHRDDVEFRLGDDPAKARASQGQTRTMALAWKWEERGFLREMLGREPITLLDDVLSELDPDRRAVLGDLLSESGQCLLTLTDFTVWPRSSSGPPAPARIFRVSAGTVTVDRRPAPGVIP